MKAFDATAPKNRSAPRRRLLLREAGRAASRERSLVERPAERRRAGPGLAVAALADEGVDGHHLALRGQLAGGEPGGVGVGEREGLGRARGKGGPRLLQEGDLLGERVPGRRGGSGRRLRRRGGWAHGGPGRRGIGRGGCGGRGLRGRGTGAGARSGGGWGQGSGGGRRSGGWRGQPGRNDRGDDDGVSRPRPAPMAAPCRMARVPAPAARLAAARGDAGARVVALLGGHGSGMRGVAEEGADSVRTAVAGRREGSGHGVNPFLLLEAGELRLRNCFRATERRDQTVPTGTPRMVAMASQDSSSISNITKTARFSRSIASRTRSRVARARRASRRASGRSLDGTSPSSGRLSDGVSRRNHARLRWAAATLMQMP